MLLIRVPRLSLTAFTLIAALLLLLASSSILPTSIIHQNSLTALDGFAHLHKSLRDRSDYSPPSESTDENDYDDDGDIEIGDDDDYASSSSGDAERRPLEWDEYARKGALAAEYLKASDANVVADLVQKGKLPPGSGLASRFTDVKNLAANGWEVRDVTQRLRDGFEQYVPFRDALKDFGLSDSARPEGKNEFMDYEHTLIWHKNGQELEPVGRSAQFSFVTNPTQATLIITLGYSTDYIIRKHRLHLNEIQSPPLSHKSDLTFLEWKRACTRSHSSMKNLKHIFLSVVLTPETHEAVRLIYSSMGKELSSFAALPKWAEKDCWTPEEESGRVLLGTIQVQGLVWMFLQHRAGLGKKGVKRVCVFGDSNEVDKGRGPSIYVDVRGLL